MLVGQLFRSTARSARPVLPSLGVAARPSPLAPATAPLALGATRGFASRKHKKFIKLAKGYRGRANRCFRIAVQRVEKAWQYAYRDRKARRPASRPPSAPARFAVPRARAGVVAGKKAGDAQELDPQHQREHARLRRALQPLHLGHALCEHRRRAAPLDATKRARPTPSPPSQDLNRKVLADLSMCVAAPPVLWIHETRPPLTRAPLAAPSRSRSSASSRSRAPTTRTSRAAPTRCAPRPDPSMVSKHPIRSTSTTSLTTSTTSRSIGRRRRPRRATRASTGVALVTLSTHTS